jgi:hypothetical protein
MEITAQPLDWTSNDEEQLARFLTSPTGQRFIPKLLEVTPALLEQGHVNKILIRSGIVRGFQILASEILRLAHPSSKPTEQTPTEYPALDDDAKWGKPPPEPALDFVPDIVPAPEPTPESQITKE